MARIPNTDTTVSYSYALSANGKTIGTLQGFTPTNNRNLERVREINGTTTTADIKEVVFGRGEITLRIDRFETYNTSVLEALGLTIVDLSQITDPITITETMEDGQGNVTTIQYLDCAIQSCSKTVREGTITVGEAVDLWPTQIVKL